MGGQLEERVRGLDRGKERLQAREMGGGTRKGEGLTKEGYYCSAAVQEGGCRYPIILSQDHVFKPAWRERGRERRGREGGEWARGSQGERVKDRKQEKTRTEGLS